MTTYKGCPMEYWFSLYPEFDILSDNQAAYAEKLQETIRVSLQNLLNTRSNMEIPGDQFPDLKTSALTYGAPDFMSLDYSSKQHQLMLCQHIEKSIRQYEPRLTNIDVRWHDNPEPDRTLFIAIDATLNFRQKRIPVLFYTEFDQINQTFHMDY